MASHDLTTYTFVLFAAQRERHTDYFMSVAGRQWLNVGGTLGGIYENLIGVYPLLVSDNRHIM